jgi:hypothetical protein
VFSRRQPEFGLVSSALQASRIRLRRGSELHRFSGMFELIRLFADLVPFVPHAGEPHHSSDGTRPAEPGASEPLKSRTP